MPISFEYDLVGKKGTNPVTYNSMNLPSAETTKREDVDAAASFEYDENGNIIREEHAINGESVIYNIDCIIDEKGRLIKEVCTYPDDSQESLEYTYNEKGYLIKEVYKMYDDNQTTYDFTYDEHGNVIKEVFTNVDGTTNYVKTEYKLMYIPAGITEGTYAFFVDFWGDRL